MEKVPNLFSYPTPSRTSVTSLRVKVSLNWPTANTVPSLLPSRPDHKCLAASGCVHLIISTNTQAARTEAGLCITSRVPGFTSQKLSLDTSTPTESS